MDRVLQARWLAEVSLMRNTFPAFEPFVSNGVLSDLMGFQGSLPGKSRKLYEVTIRAKISGYPVQAPKIHISPWVGPNRYLDGSLCVNRSWRPQQDTFAQQVLYAAHYLQQHG